jgi:hypothetical protein
MLRAPGIRKLVLALLAVGAMLALTASAQSTTPPPPSPPFAECPPVGAATTGCNLLIVLNADGTTSILPSGQGPYDGSEDATVGVLNNTGFAVPSVQLSSTTDAIFGFDNDGLCSVPDRPAGCPFGSTGYEGPGTSFTGISGDQKSGTVTFAAPLQPGGSKYFSLEGALTGANITLPALTFQQQPSDVQVGQSMTPLVTVQLMNGSTPIVGQPVTLSLGPGSPSSTISGNGPVMTDANGIAAFPSLSFGSSGTGFSLVATSGSLTATSNPFNVAAILVNCTAGCNASTPDPTAQNPTSVDINVPGSSGLRSLATGGGQLEVILDPSAPGFCGGSPCIGQNITIIPPATAGGTITADFIYDKSISGQRGVALINVWKLSPGSSTPVLVPDCKGKNPTLPCVNKRTRTNPGNAFIEVLFTGPDPIWGSG